MQRLDPQDAGPAYRNVIGLPGGVKSPLFKVLEVIAVKEQRTIEWPLSLFPSHMD